MPNFEKLEGKRKGSVNFVHEGFIYTKNNADSLKTRLRCHRWRDGCKGTAFIQDNHFHLNIKCQICGCRISNNITIHFDEVEWYFHVFQCFNLDGALAYRFFNLFHFVNFCNILTILCSMLFNEPIDLDKFQELVDFGRSFCFSWKVRCPIVEHFVH